MSKKNDKSNLNNYNKMNDYNSSNSLFEPDFEDDYFDDEDDYLDEEDELDEDDLILENDTSFLFSNDVDKEQFLDSVFGCSVTDDEEAWDSYKDSEDESLLDYEDSEDDGEEWDEWSSDELNGWSTEVDWLSGIAIYPISKVEPCEIDNLLYKQEYWDKTFATLFRKKLNADTYNELYALQGNYREFVSEILNCNFDWGIPKKLYIPKSDGKKRVVYMFGTKQRALLGVLNRLLSDLFADSISPVCYSYKQGVSTISAVRDLRVKAYKSDHKPKNTRNETINAVRVYDYALKIDISKYFNSVSAKRITEMLDTLFTPDKRGVIYELLRVLFSISECYDKGVLIQEYLSILPGVATASFFANYCLYDLDEHFRKLGVPYARYCDDIIVFGKTREDLKSYVSYIENELNKSGLKFNEKKFCEYDLNSTDVEFLGLKFSGDSIDISDASFKKIKKKIKHTCKLARNRVWQKHNSPLSEVQGVIKWFNYLWYKCYVFDRSKFGWGYYAFRFITTDETIRKIDYYLRDTLRFVYTGKYNKANVRKLPNEKLNDLGYVSLTMMYGIFKSDYEVYLDFVSRLK